jgi:predicted dehydrogenase
MTAQTTATGSSGPVLRVAVIGHSFMGTIHTHAWQTAPKFFDPGVDIKVAAVCGRDEQAARAFARRFDIESVETDWRKLVARDDVDIVDICTPGRLHAEIAIAALEAGKHVLCEKPLANTLAEAEAMDAAATAASKRGIRSMVGFSYRRTPALAYARDFIAAGRLGDIRHIRALYLQDWIVDPDFPLVWRLVKEEAGSGALGDLGAHLVDLVGYLTEHTITGVSALTDTFVTSRPLPGASSGLSATATEERGTVTVDDAAIAIARTDRGALLTLEATRFATGRKNALRIEINGSRGSLAFDFERLNELEFADATLPSVEGGFRRILVTEPEHPYAGAWWPPGHGLGYEQLFVHQAKDFAEGIVRENTLSPSFADGLRVQRVLDAIERSAASGSRWTSVHQ